MLDEKTLRLFSAVHETSGGNFKIMEEGDLVRVFKESEGVDAKAVREMIFALEGHRFLDVRYCEDGEYCLCSLPAGVNFLKEQSGERRARARSFGKETLLVFLASLVGGFLGALCALAVAL